MFLLVQMKKGIHYMRSISISALIALIILLAGDLFVHSILKEKGGYNWQGFRGDIDKP